MKSLLDKDSKIYYNLDGYNQLNSQLLTGKFSKVIILVDTNTREKCLESFLSKLKTDLSKEVLVVEAGEEYKTIDTCVKLWNELTQIGADRKSIIINLGGGVITDLGGFVASAYKRGVKYINVPTSLLAMVDASIGGKTGVDLGVLKNQIGIIANSEMVLIDSNYLKTLPENQLKSGLSEMLKHGLIYDHVYWDQMKKYNYDLQKLDDLIKRSVDIKKEIVSKDPTELGIRKTLNFGHTLGHAIESFYLEKDPENALLHGEAIAIGMIMETFISKTLLNFPEKELDEIRVVFNSLFKNKPIAEDDFEEIIDLMKYDKKNSHGNVNFVLLQKIGKPKIDCEVKNSILLKAFDNYNQNL